MRLSQLANNQTAIITKVLAVTENTTDMISQRLSQLGFEQGEPVQVLGRGLFGGEPILVKIGHSRFALRRAEANRIEVMTQ
ncbi:MULTISPECIES: ferrous iron transport protein A [unclassified Acinetobacter]|uniref:FeoA family protein n=1 Tax=unclassified Acinetobacter TaxID=196816 RepID=UPI0035B9E781